MAVIYNCVGVAIGSWMMSDLMASRVKSGIVSIATIMSTHPAG